MIAIVYAMAGECAGLLERLGGSPLPDAVPFPLYALPDGTLVAVGGVGKVNAAMATQALLDRFPVHEVWNAGCAGAFSDLPVGAIVVGSHCVQHDVDTSLAGDEPGLVSTVERVEFPCDFVEDTLAALPHAQAGVIATGDWFGRDFDRARGIWERYHAAVCDMEGCACAQVCLRNRVPFRAVKAVSDHLLSPAQDQEYQANFPRTMTALDEAVAALLDRQRRM